MPELGGLALSSQGNDLMGSFEEAPSLRPSLPDTLTQLERKAGVPSRMFGDQSLSACCTGSPWLPVNPRSGPWINISKLSSDQRCLMPVS